MGDEEQSQAGIPEGLQKRIADLESKLSEETSKLEAEAARSKQLSEDLAVANRDINYWRKVFEHLNKQGAALRKQLESRELRHERIRPDELYLVGRYVSGSEDDIALLEKFSNADRFLSWSKQIFFEPLYALDQVGEGLGKTLYQTLIDARSKISVIDMESLVRYAAVQLLATQNDLNPDDARHAIISQVTAAAEGQNAAYLSAARGRYHEYVKGHYAFYKSLEAPADLLLELRDKAKGSWDGVRKEVEEMHSKQINQVPVLGMPWLSVDVYRQRLDVMERYEDQHGVDLRWYRDLPKDLGDFCESPKA
jgi:hypothetical protein